MLNIVMELFFIEIIKSIKIKKYYIYHKIFLFLISFQISTEKPNNLFKLISNSEIIISIKGKDTQPILNNQTISLLNPGNNSNQDYKFETKPSEIIVNGNKVKEIDFYVYNN